MNLSNAIKRIWYRWFPPVIVFKSEADLIKTLQELVKPKEKNREHR